MANMLDYLDWYGDFNIETLPFNEVDALILAQLAYLDMEGVVPTGDAGVTMVEASRAFFERHAVEEVYAKGTGGSALTPFVLQKMAAGSRFRTARLSAFAERFDASVHRQFAAYTAELADGSVYVAFRGTDDTLTGWREDFEMGFTTVHAQRDALEYLERAARVHEGTLLRVGGHSKGGNLAVYASALVSPEVQGRSIAVYDFDGPGFIESVLPARAVRPLRRRMRRVIPEHSVVGQLLQSAKPWAVCKSSGEGMGQHDATTWQVKGTGFEAVEKPDEGSRRFKASFARWVESVPMDRRRVFVGELFDAFEAAGARCFGDIMNLDAAGVARLAGAFEIMSPQARGIAVDLLTVLLGAEVEGLLGGIARPQGAGRAGTTRDEGDAHKDHATLDGFRRWHAANGVKRRRESLAGSLTLACTNRLVRGVLLAVFGLACMVSAFGQGTRLPTIVLAIMALVAVFAAASASSGPVARVFSSPAGMAGLGALVAALLCYAATHGISTILFNVLVGGGLVADAMYLARMNLLPRTAAPLERRLRWAAVAIAAAAGIVLIVHPALPSIRALAIAGAFICANGVFDIARFMLAHASLWRSA